MCIRDRAQREQKLDATTAIHQACLIRFRPIMMTTAAALMAGLPIALGYGAGGESRRPEAPGGELSPPGPRGEEVGAGEDEKEEGRGRNHVTPGGALRVADGRDAEVLQLDPPPRRSDCEEDGGCLLYTSPSPRDRTRSRMPSSA